MFNSFPAKLQRTFCCCIFSSTQATPRQSATSGSAVPGHCRSSFANTSLSFGLLQLVTFVHWNSVFCISCLFLFCFVFYGLKSGNVLVFSFNVSGSNLMVRIEWRFPIGLNVFGILFFFCSQDKVWNCEIGTRQVASIRFISNVYYIYDRKQRTRGHVCMHEGHTYQYFCMSYWIRAHLVTWSSLYLSLC